MSTQPSGQQPELVFFHWRKTASCSPVRNEIGLSAFAYPSQSWLTSKCLSLLLCVGGFFSTIFSSLFGTREMRILILGLDGAGKTTILYRLQVGEVVTTIPTIGFNVETVTYKNLKFQVWDLGGQTSIRPYWRCYYSNTDAVIYVVDSCDRDRIGTSKSELVAMLEEEELKKAILVVFANKQDMEQAMTPTEMANALGLPALKDRKWQIFKTSATKGTGLDEAMEWLVEALKSRQ